MKNIKSKKNSSLYLLWNFPLLLSHKSAENKRIISSQYERIGIKRYQTGDGYKWHTDGIDLRRLTNVLFLNNDYTGGDLRIFCGEEVVIKNNIGVLVTFPSWYFHQADVIESGERKVLVILAEGPKFEFF